ncbi:MAG: multicopper oxidase domain-containing protein [Gemmatimonadaceae bacterium]
MTVSCGSGVARTPLAKSESNARSSASTVHANDNRKPAGTLRAGKLELRLTVGMAKWYPEADNGPSVDVAAFAEEGGRPQVPAPLIRVPVGTTVVATVRNSLPDSTVYIHGLATRPSVARDTISLRPGESRTITFPAGAVGTYLYYATLGTTNRYVLRPNPQSRRVIMEREQLSGAFVVDSTTGSTDDRIFVVNVWGDSTDARGYRNVLTLNGKSWPNTERIGATTGDSLRWRVINGSARNHPMHLHGFYFRVDSRGSWLRDSTYAPVNRRLAVTESLPPGETMSMAWSPERPGNWLFHCHVAQHVTDEARLPATMKTSHSVPGHDPMGHMAGLVLGVEVRPAAGFVESIRGPARRLRLFVNEGKPTRLAPRAMSFVLQRGDHPPAADSVEIPGTVLVLKRGEPTDITVVNRLAEEMAVHWHGLELESFSDGVAGWSGDMNRVAPAIAPGGSFTARLTMPRSGTFIYHTHLNDVEGLTSGLYGALVVLDPGDRFDPLTDHLFIAGTDGSARPNKVIVNGAAVSPPLVMGAGVPHRMRFINISPGGIVAITLRRDTTAVKWRRRAKDGADLPPSAARVVPAIARLDVGETVDVEFLPPFPGEYTLAIGNANTPPRYLRKIIVR